MGHQNVLHPGVARIPHVEIPCGSLVERVDEIRQVMGAQLARFPLLKGLRQRSQGSVQLSLVRQSRVLAKELSDPLGAWPHGHNPKGIWETG